MGLMLLVAAGFFSGMVSGMGIGGGVILIPVLTLFSGIPQKAAQGINLLYFIPTAVVALCVHYKNKSIDIKAALPVAAFGAAAAAAGAYLAGIIPPGVLRRIFALLTIFVGINEIYIAVKKER